jgi:hypothetical protein
MLQTFPPAFRTFLSDFHLHRFKHNTDIWSHKEWRASWTVLSCSRCHNKHNTKLIFNRYTQRQKYIAKKSCKINTKSKKNLHLVTWLDVTLSLVSFKWKCSSARMKAYLFAFNFSLQNTARCCHAEYQLVRYKHMQALRTKSQYRICACTSRT